MKESVMVKSERSRVPSSVSVRKTLRISTTLSCGYDFLVNMAACGLCLQMFQVKNRGVR